MKCINFFKKMAAALVIAAAVMICFMAGCGGNEDPVGSGITPSKFVMGIAGIDVFTPAGESMSIGQGLFDFAEDLTVNVGEIPTDVTCALMSIWINSMGAVTGDGESSGPGYIKFKWPVGKTAFDTQKPQHKIFYESYIPESEHTPVGFTPEWNEDEGTITMLLDNVVPGFRVQNGLQLSGTAPDALFSIFYGKGPRRFYNSGGVPVNTLIEGLDSYGGGFTEMGGIGDSSIVIPFIPISVPATASSVTFNLSWNLDGIVQQYDNKTPADVTDDIFVLRNGWWNDLRINASVQ